MAGAPLRKRQLIENVIIWGGWPCDVWKERLLSRGCEQRKLLRCQCGCSRERKRGQDDSLSSLSLTVREMERHREV